MGSLLTKIPKAAAALFIGCLFVLQMLAGTAPLFAVLSALYFALFVAAYNTAGGLSYASGAYIFFNGVFACLFGLILKALLFQAGDSHLLVPLQTMSAYCVGMFGMLLAAKAVSVYRRGPALLGEVPSNLILKRAAVGSLILGVSIQVFLMLMISPGGEAAERGVFFSGLSQFNRFTLMSIPLSVMYEIRASNRKRSLNWIAICAGAWIGLFGILGASKEGMLLPLVAWMVPSVMLGFRLAKVQIMGILAFLLVFSLYLAPYSQYARSQLSPDNSFSANAAIATYFLLHPSTTKRLDQESNQSAEETKDPTADFHFFDGDGHPFYDRLQMLSVDDALIAYTEQGNEIGFAPTLLSFANVVPHFLWKNKPVPLGGNYYGRELGIIDPADETTGISFSPTGEAWHEGRWWGVGVLMPAVLFLLFLIMDKLGGETTKSPWALLYVLLAAHLASEGSLGGAVWLISTGTYIVIAIALLVKFVLPVLGQITVGGGKRTAAVR